MELKKLINSQGFYGYLDIEVKLIANQEGATLRIANEDAKNWFSALQFGVDYFYEKFSLRNNSVGLSVLVNNLISQPVDSSFSIFFFLMVKSLIDETSFSIPYFELDQLEGIFRLPK